MSSFHNKERSPLGRMGHRFDLIMPAMIVCDYLMIERPVCSHFIRPKQALFAHF
jgi:hypothetical protein